MDLTLPKSIDNANNLVFWCRFLNRLEPWYTVYIMQQLQNTLILTWLTDTNFLGKKNPMLASDRFEIFNLQGENANVPASSSHHTSDKRLSRHRSRQNTFRSGSNQVMFGHSFKARSDVIVRFSALLKRTVNGLTDAILIYFWNWQVPAVCWVQFSVTRDLCKK